jgi:hypothetical protein
LPPSITFRRSRPVDHVRGGPGSVVVVDEVAVDEVVVEL